MRRVQLEHAIRTACQIIQQPEVIVVGSQAILGTYGESQLPAAVHHDGFTIVVTNDSVLRYVSASENATLWD